MVCHVIITSWCPGLTNLFLFRQFQFGLLHREYRDLAASSIHPKLFDISFRPTFMGFQRLNRRIAGFIVKRLLDQIFMMIVRVLELPGYDLIVLSWLYLLILSALKTFLITKYDIIFQSHILDPSLLWNICKISIDIDHPFFCIELSH